MSTLSDILNNGKGELSPDKLKAYLEGRLSPEEQREIEAWLTDEGFEDDAVEGLKTLSAKETNESVNRLNHFLQKQLSEKRRKRKGPIRDNKWALVAVVVILLLCALAYIILHFLLRK